MQQYSLGLWDRAFSFLLITNQTIMKTQQTTISEVICLKEYIAPKDSLYIIHCYTFNAANQI
jgi:hypothetical protein